MNNAWDIKVKFLKCAVTRCIQIIKYTTVFIIEEWIGISYFLIGIYIKSI